MSTASAAAAPTSSGFAYSRAQFRDLVESCLASAKALGASDAVAEASEGVGLSVSVRKGETENIERNRDKSISVTVYVGQRRGNASTSDFSTAAVEQTVRAAHDIARFTAEDPAAGLPDAGGPRRSRRPQRATSTCSIPGRSMPSRRSRWPRVARRRRSRSIAASPIPKAPASRRSSRISTRATRAASAPAMPARAIRSRSRRSRRCPAVAATTCSATPGTRRCARPKSLRRPRRWAAMPPSARCRAWRRARSRPARCRCCSSRRWRRGCSARYVQATSGGALYRKSSFLLD